MTAFVVLCWTLNAARASVWAF